MCLYVCAYMYACMYVYVCICMCVYVCVHVCIYVYMHACIFVSSSSSTAMGSAPVGVQCQFPLLPPTSSVRRHLCIFVYVCIIHIYIYMSWGKCPMKKCPTQNERRNCPGVNCPGVNCPEGNCPGDYIVLRTDRRLPNFRFVRFTAKSPLVHG